MHKNGNKLDNCILNLQLVTPSEHIKIHCGDQKGGNNYNYKPYATVIKKKGFSRSGKQRYGINFNGKQMWAMQDKQEIVDMFCAEYPLEIIKTR